MTTHESDPAALRGLRIISAGLIGGIVFLLAMVLFVRQNMHISGSLDFLAYVAAGWAVVSVPIASVLRAARWPGTTPEQDPGYWPKRRAAHIISMGFVEGPAFFCCVTLLLARPWWTLAALLVPIGAMVAWFPRDA